MNNDDLRDQIAISAMASLIREGFYTRGLANYAGPRSHEHLARTAYGLANAMIGAREALEFASDSREPSLFD
jgi:hypothetical protein